ncbi:MAG: response regulator [Bacteroidetes bacterium]|nr:response regulator [Bacteroidota bacterium]MBT3933268.1 response regulator [Bacteroidota bacterium]MBT4339804.1 response regulator [Bacteroidota bacterium]MBT4728013.1 response regulator [Bacteroidota bacterium]MBT6837207.1 response regulator [Bacteroidota bacterium]
MSETQLSIMLVEDDEVDIMNVKRAFKKNNITNPIMVARNGLEALDMLTKPGIALPKVIILDINMPRMNGIEFLKEIRKDEKLKMISVFVMTTSNQDSDKIKAYDLNVAGYILKPLSFEKFVTSVATLNSYWSLCERPD